MTLQMLAGAEQCEREFMCPGLVFATLAPDGGHDQPCQMAANSAGKRHWASDRMQDTVNGLRMALHGANVACAVPHVPRQIVCTVQTTLLQSGCLFDVAQMSAKKPVCKREERNFRHV